MKKFLCASGVLVLVIACLIVPRMQLRTAPAIAVSLQDETGGGTDYIPAVDGFISGHGGLTAGRDNRKEDYSVDLSFKVISTPEGQFSVLAHYVVDRNGVLTTVDRTLPVFAKQPEKTKWVSVDDHLIACASLSQNTLRY